MVKSKKQSKGQSKNQTGQCFEHEIKQLKKKHQESVDKLAQMSKLADIGFLSAGVAHEVNNPLATIKLCMESIEHVLKTKGQVPEMVFEQIDIVQASIARISKLTHQMVKLGRDEEHHPKPTDLSSLLRSILKLYSHKVTALQVELHEFYDEGFDILCDPSKIEQVVINILNNALYALEEKATDRKLEIHLISEEKQVSLRIWNNGNPIPKETQNKIFTPFFSEKPVEKGTGLGLAISHGIMKKHHGDLQFASNKTDGTSFTLVFPSESRSESSPETSKKDFKKVS